jgi:hypothetical protein
MVVTLVFCKEYERSKLEVVFNRAMSVVATVKGKICEEYKRSKLAGIFRGETFGFLQLMPAWLLDGD